MRISHIVATHGAWGGLERAVVDLAEEQVAQGHEVAVIAAPIVLERVGEEVARVPLRFDQSRRNPFLLFSLFRSLNQFKPDIVHAHANKAAAAFNCIRPFMRGIPSVATVQNTKRSVRMFRPYDAVIAVSKRAGDQLGDIPHEVIWNAIPKPEMPAELEGDLADLPFRNGGKVIVAAIGRLVEAKGFDYLLQAVKDVDAYFWIIGSGALESELKQQAKDLGVADRVWFAGFRQDAEALMQLADFMVISSRREGFPFAFVEMLHRRKIVVGTRVAGVEEVLEPPYLVDVGDVPALAKAIEWTAFNLEKARQDFSKYWAVADEELDLRKTAVSIEAVYEKLRR